jgi:hypothetical protein
VALLAISAVLLSSLFANSGVIERPHTLARLAEDEEPGCSGGAAGSRRGLVKMKTVQPPSITIRQIEFELEKAEHGMAMPYDAERVGQLRKMLVEARKRKLWGGLARTIAIAAAPKPKPPKRPAG